MWVNIHNTKDSISVDSDGKVGWKVPSGKGQRLIVVHTDGGEGWGEGAGLMFKWKTNSVDYHNEINHQHYMEWLIQQLYHQTLLSLQCNIPQHDKPPTTANKMDEIKNWLQQHTFRGQ